ncbi:hypothetical protein [Flavobacterium humi]|uniref:Uncharacterized protein n=1 Tax=Flavobacterium humi TaxID=2562683 RepID=A0A4Z0L6V6_9FLAO|nr:hypothetical protein [Flavobacterium humi]TGD57981.1 hypothetical protein E4635_08185 [Flavobacterium humi]
MDNYIKNIGKLTALSLCGLLLFSCEKEDDLLQRTGKPTVTIDQKDITVTEGDPITLDFKLSYAIPAETHIRIEVAGGTATDEDDFLFDLDTMEDAGGGFFGGNGYFFVIDPDETTATLDIETIADAMPEGTETLTLKFYSASQGRAVIDQTVNVKIND